MATVLADDEETMADDVNVQQPHRSRGGGDSLTSLNADFRRLQDNFNELLHRLREEGRSIHHEKAEVGLLLEKGRQQLREELAAEWKRVDSEKAQLKVMLERAQKYGQDSPVKLNVGGVSFTTTSQTLCAEPQSMLAAMCSETFHLQRNEEGEVILDRDSKHFHLILDYLRHLRLLPSAPIEDLLPLRSFTEETRSELAAEAEFFGLQRLHDKLKRTALVVSTESTSRYRRVSEALQDARNGDTIIVKPGLYYDSIALLHDVEVVGDGPKESIVIRSPCGNVVECRTPSATVRGLTLECFPPDAPSESYYGDYYGVFISEGSLVLEDCEVRCVGLSCIKIVGGPKAGVSTIRRNDVHSAHQCGILLANSADALIQHNTIHHNRFSGVEIRNGAKPKLQANRIFENVQNGVYIHSHGEGVVEGNHLYKNKFNGINGEGNVLVSSNVIHENMKRGIFYGSQMTLQNNEVYWNSLGDFAPRR